MQEKKKSPSTGSSGLVKDIFSRQKAGKDKVSTLFTHFKHTPKPVPQPKMPLPSGYKPFPPAIDIGTSSIKVIQLAEDEKGKLKIIAIDQEPYTELQVALKKVINRNKLSGPCVTSLAAKDIQLYNMIFPPMSETELRAAIQYKITQLKPFNLTPENLYYKFKKWEIPGLPTMSQQRVIIACASKDAVSKRIELFKEHGMHVKVIEPLPFSLINLSRFYKPVNLKEEVMLWIDLGAEESFIAIERGGVLSFSRNLNSTSENMTKAVAQRAHVSEDEAGQLKKKFGLSFWAPDKFMPPFNEPEEGAKGAEDKSEVTYYGLVSLLENMVVDIEHTFKYFSYQVAQSQVTKFDRVMLAGGGVNLTNLDTFLSTKLGVPVERVNTFSIFGFSEAVQERRKDLIAAPADFAAACGLALSEKVPSAERVNLLPEGRKGAMQAFSSAMKEKPIKIAVAVMLAAAVLTGAQIIKAGYYKGRMSSLTSELRTSKARLGKLQTRQLEQAKQESELLTRKELLEARLELLQNSYRAPEEFSAVLGSFASLLPEEIWVTDLTYKDEKMVLSGSTPDINLISELIDEIKIADEFVDAGFNHSEKEPAREVYKFEIAIEVKK